MATTNDLRKKLQAEMRKVLENGPRDRIQVICSPYGSGKTHIVQEMADAKAFPVLMTFYTRELRDKTYREFQRDFPGKTALKLDSPMEFVAADYEINEHELYRYVDANSGTYFEKALTAYLELVDIRSPAEVKAVLAAYKQRSRRFKRRLAAFFNGEADILFMTQQGLMLRVLHSKNFRIPDTINVVLDELEVALWTEGELAPSSNNRAQLMLASGGRWSILTGDSRPVRLRMPRQFRVVDLLEKQFINPIDLHTYAPLGVGNSIQPPMRGSSQHTLDKYRALADARNHQNRAVALPLIAAEERAKAKRDGKKLIMVGNVGKDEFADLGIRTFESMKGDNWLWKSKRSYRIPLFATCPPEEVLKQNSLLFGTRCFEGFVKSGNKGTKGKGLTPEERHSWRAAFKEQNVLLDADLMDKVAQIVARVRGFRNRPDCDVVIYLWSHIDQRYVYGKLPFVWLPPTDPDNSLVLRIYNKGQKLGRQSNVLGDRLRVLKISKKAIRTNHQFQKVQGAFRKNLGLVCDELVSRIPSLQSFAQSLEDEALKLDEADA